MFGCTDLPDAPWTVVKSNDKRRARLGVLRNVLSLIPYEDRDECAAGRPDPLIVGPVPLAPRRAGAQVMQRAGKLAAIER
jgi:hypothetical protein